MNANEQSHIDLTESHGAEHKTTLGLAELEQRITPLVVIAIIAILIGLLLPA